CDAYFEYIETSVDPHTYQFVDLSVGEIENWEWDFGDNTTSTLQNPLHSYYDPGEYTICLTVSDEEGNCYDAYCETIFAGVTPQCTAFYTYVQDTTNYMTFQFVDLSIGNIASWEWDFGDGSFSGEQSPVHTYTSEDLYFICLTIVNETGICEDVFCQEIMVTNQVPCQADFDYFILPADPLSVQFMDLSGGSIDLWFWDFGDGDFSFDQSPLHTYDEDGEYLVCLNVMDFLTGCADQFCRMVEVSHIPTCEADFTYISSMNDPLSFQFVDLSSGNIAEWLWDFGDGTTSLTQNPDHIFTDEGTYEVCLSITDMWGICQDVHCEFIEIVLPDLCEADFDNTSIPDQLLAVQFIDQSEGIMTQWQWDFGDGSTSMLQNPVHIFPDSGYYSVQLSIVNPDSIVYCESAIVKNIHVFETAPNCQANFIAFPDSGINRPNLFHFSDLSTGSPTSWSWDFDDGTNSTEQNPVHQYDDFGSWEVKLIILTENQWGDDCEDEMSLTINSPEYFHIGGLLYAGDFPINNPEHTGDTAEICIYRQKNNVLTPLDTGRFVELGYFYFLHLLASDYLIKVNLTGGSSTHRVFFPTYLGEHLTWQQAAILHIADSSYYNLDINLNKIPDSENGIGLINGSVIHNPRKNVPPFPAGNTEILLFNNDNIPVNYAYSNQNGIFQFDNLPMGTYKVIAESTGMYSEPVFITLTESNPAAYDVKIEIFEDDLTSISEHPNKFDGMFVYPNPFREILNVDFAPGFPQDIIVRFFDITGKEIEIDEQNVSVGSGKLKIDLGYFPRGLYLLKLYSEEGMILQAEKVFKL
nr:PKD domain-containing protein [Bacteroidota bacterium]